MKGKLTAENKERLEKALAEAEKINYEGQFQGSNPNELYKLRMQVVTKQIKKHRPEIKQQKKHMCEYLNYFKVNPIVKKPVDVNYAQEYNELFKSQQKKSYPQKGGQIFKPKENLFQSSVPKEGQKMSFIKDREMEGEVEEQNRLNSQILIQNQEQKEKKIVNISPFGIITSETEKPKYNIFNHNIVLPESQPADLATAKGPLFSEKNPWFQEKKSEDKSSLSNIFFNKNDETKELKKEEEKIEKKFEPLQNQNQFVTSAFTNQVFPQPIQSTEKKEEKEKTELIPKIELFQNKEPTLFGERQKNVEKSQSEGKFETEKKSETKEISKQEQKEQKQEQKIQKVQKKEEKPSIFGGSLNQNIFGNKKVNMNLSQPQNTAQPFSKPFSFNPPPSQKQESSNPLFPSKTEENSFNVFTTKNQPSLFAKKEESSSVAKPPTFEVPSKPSLFNPQAGSSLFQNETSKPNVFMSGSNMFNQGNMFENQSKPTIQNNMFGNQNAQSSQSNMFSNQGNMFGNPTPSNNMFTKDVSSHSFSGFSAKPEEANEEEGGDDENELYETEEAPIDPSKSTGNYEYEKSQVFFKQIVQKLRKGTADTLENVTVSIEKPQNSKNLVLYVRMVNKCIYFYGTLLKDITEVAEMKSGVFKNVSVKKVVTEVESEGVKKNVLEALKIKFKEEKHGKAFIAACSK